MTYAIIQLAGKQYKVSPGDTIVVDQLPYKEGETFTVSDVLLVSNDAHTTVGAPLVQGATVSAKIQTHQKGEKIRVATYRSKSRTRKVRGHRQHQSVVEVTGVSA